MAKSKFALKLGPISLLFWPKISTSLWDPLGCSDLSQIFFGSSPVATDWDKTVAEIIHTTFVFLGHPSGWFIKVLGLNKLSNYSPSAVRI